MCVRDDGDLRSHSLNGLGSLDSQHCDNIHQLERSIDLRIVRGWDCIPVTTGGSARFRAPLDSPEEARSMVACPVVVLHQPALPLVWASGQLVTSALIKFWTNCVSLYKQTRSWNRPQQL